MQKIVPILAVVFLVFVILIPVLGRGGDDESSPSAEAAYTIPDHHEAPPRWDAQSLVGTVWQADMRTAPREEHRGDMFMIFSFLSGGRVALDIEDTEEPDPDVSEEDRIFQEHLRNALFPQFHGVYSVDGHQVQVEVEMLQAPRNDTFEIRGVDLYYHGIRMQQMESNSQTGHAI